MTETPHDALFKAVFSEPARAAEAVAFTLGPEIARLIDFSTLRLVDGSFVDEDLRGHHTDLLFTAQLAGCPVFFHLLFEHQSSADWAMALRLLRYMVRIWVAHCVAHPHQRKLPLIIPVVLSHNEPGWRASTDFADLIDLPDAARELLHPFIPKFRFALDDLTAAGAEALYHRAVSVQVRLACLALLEGRRTRPLGDLLRGWFDLMAEAGANPPAVRALELVLRYLLDVRGADEYYPAIETTAREIRNHREGHLMETIAQMLRREGRTEGRTEGRRELVRRMLHRRFGDVPAAVLTRLEGADIAALDRWADLLMDDPHGSRGLAALLDV